MYASPLRPGGEGLLAGAVFRIPQGKEEGAAPVILRETQIEHLLIDRSIDCASHTPRRLAMEQAQVTITPAKGSWEYFSPV